MSRRGLVEVTAGALLAAGLSMASTPSHALSGFLTTLTNAYPTAAPLGCGNCHTSATSPGSRNSFGSAFGDAGNTLTAALRAADSDGDGFSNDAELRAGTNPGSATSRPAVTTTTTTTTTTTARPTTTTAAPTTTTTARPTTTTAAPTTTTTARPTTTTAAPTTTTTARPTTTTAAVTTTTTTRPTTTTTASTTTTTQASSSSGAALYAANCASCHDGAAASGGGRQVLGSRSCSIVGAINGTSVFPNGVPAMRFLQGVLSAAQIQAIADFLNAGTVTGQQRYITNCAGCHGADARGGRTGESVRGASAGDTREAIEDEREMRYLSCLPASDVNAIGSYLRGVRRGGDDRDDRDHDDDDDD